MNGQRNLGHCNGYRIGHRRSQRCFRVHSSWAQLMNDIVAAGPIVPGHELELVGLLANGHHGLGNCS